MNTLQPSHAADDLRLLSREDLTDAPAVTESQALMNRALGKGPRLPRPERRGLLAVSEATFDRWVASGEFPRGLKIGPRMVRWPASAVKDWIAKRLQAA